jgi:hypothetical protein
LKRLIEHVGSCAKFTMRSRRSSAGAADALRVAVMVRVVVITRRGNPRPVTKAGPASPSVSDPTVTVSSCRP